MAALAAAHYDFLASVMPDTNPAWERLSILLNLLTAKLPAPKEAWPRASWTPLTWTATASRSRP
ncbi:MAG: hypothetical protein ABIR94_14665 [Rubrivivax sp.]